MAYPAQPGTEPEWVHIDREGVHLAALDFGGTGRPVLLIYGLAGHAEEWSETASWLVPEHQVLVPEIRGHGRSDRQPPDVFREAHVADIVAWIHFGGGGPVTLVGQSLGGHTAFLVAARHPDLVSGLVVVEADPGPSDAVASIRQWLDTWPISFPSREAAVDFFGRNERWARAWAGGLECRDGGIYPSFDPGVMLRTVAETNRSYWDDWRAVRCPTLIVSAQDREPSDTVRRMADEQALASLVEIPHAGHDLHLDNPTAWREALLGFLTKAAPPGG